MTDLLKFVQIRSIKGRKLFECEALNIRHALEQAVAEEADLSGADLTGASLVNARLDGADLTDARLVNARIDGASLVNARLDGADLTDARLDGARLDGADLTDARLVNARLDGASLVNARLDGADLTDARLDGARLVNARLDPIRDDLREVLAAATEEVHGLLAALREGRVDGSTYLGSCACLVGTIANVRGCDIRELMGITPDSDRPAERWFLAIRRGDMPDNSVIAKITESWITEWLEEDP